MKFNDFEIIIRSRSIPVPVSSRSELKSLSIESRFGFLSLVVRAPGNLA
jgi:hypothetical protein